ncbi:MAG: addiction module antitoxin [Betaproteobacteria bacterium]
MHKRMTITLDEEVYEGLRRRVGARKMSQFIEELLRPHVLDQALDEGYKAMAADAQREASAADWAQALGQDAASETR